MFLLIVFTKICVNKVLIGRITTESNRTNKKTHLIEKMYLFIKEGWEKLLSPRVQGLW